MRSDAEWLDILRTNQGFVQPHRWIGYARRHGFRPVPATKLSSCPDCGEVNGRTIGQYVYYSTLISLKACARCNLLYSDTRIHPAIIRSHFDRAYNDEDYFLVRRQRIFEQIVGEVASRAPRGGAVLDVGGAKGHLMASVQRRRPDLAITVNDLSRSKCEWAESHYGLRTICGSAADLAGCSETFDVVTAIDVLYYEPNISQLWSVLAGLLTPRGTVILRVPNNLPAILGQRLVVNALTTATARQMRTRINHFNPEHLYVVSKKYLAARLAALGCSAVDVLPSPVLESSGGMGGVLRLYHRLAQALHFLSGRRLTITPGVLVIGSRR
jgi:2-polyprenyl-3-methyl-5-hydroxy-6-metoxy-1,4-benzoquinol methylase